MEPARLLAGLVDVLGATLDSGEPEDILLVLQHEEDMLPQLIDTLGRMDHPRVGEVLEVIGEHHPARAVAKAARTALIKHRNR